MSRQTIAMTDDLVDYVLSVSRDEHPVLAALRQETAALPQAAMQISRLQGHVMQLLIRLLGARRIVEVGTFTGYSALCMALALPDDGRIVALDVSREWTAIAERYWTQAGVRDRIDLRLGPAADSLQAMIGDGGAGSYDFAFIDADKTGYPTYWEHALTLLRPGGCIAVDNVLFSGVVVPAFDRATLEKRYADRPRETADALIETIEAIRAFNRMARDDARVDLAMLPLGDGLTLAVKR